MVSFEQFLSQRTLKEGSDLESGTPTSVMRMSRPAFRQTHWDLASALQDPMKRAAIIKVLDEHPEMRAKLVAMIRQAFDAVPIGGRLMPDQ